MTLKLRSISRLAMVLVHLGAIVAPTVAHGYCSSTPPPATACATVICLTADNSWEYKPKAFGTPCGDLNLGFCNGTSTYCTYPERGTVHPLYMILSVRYRPPATGSSVTYGTSRSVGTATSVTSSFSNSNGAAVSVSYSNPLSYASAGLAFNETWNTGSTESASVVQTVTEADTYYCGGQYCSDLIDHRNDMIELLLKPGINYAAFPPYVSLPAGKTQVTWGIDATSAARYSLKVGKLNGTLPWDPYEKENLERYYGITEDEFPKILAATGYGYVPASLLVPGFGPADTWVGFWKPDPDRYQYYGFVQYGHGAEQIHNKAIYNTQENQLTRFTEQSYTVSASFWLSSTSNGSRARRIVKQGA